MAEYQGLIKCNLSCESKVAASNSSFSERLAFTGWHQIIQSGLHAEHLVFIIKILSQRLRCLFSGSDLESLFIWDSGVCGYLTPNQCCIRQPFYSYMSRRIFFKEMLSSPLSIFNSNVVSSLSQSLLKAIMSAYLALINYYWCLCLLYLIALCVWFQYRMPGFAHFLLIKS